MFSLYFISVAVADTQARSTVAVLRRKRRTMLVVQHRRQPMQGLVAKTFRFDRLHRRQHIVAVDAGRLSLADQLRHVLQGHGQSDRFTSRYTEVTCSRSRK